MWVAMLWRSKSVEAPVTTWAPERRMVTRWETASTSSSLCETNMSATPRARRVATRANSRATSVWVRAVVGSSMMMIRASLTRARQMAVSCLSATDRVSTSASRSNARPSSSTMARAAGREARPEYSRRRSATAAVSTMFSPTVRLGNSEKSW